MTAIDNTPSNQNFFSPYNFTFELKRSPYLNFFIQSLNVPGISLNSPTYPTPFVNIPMAGEHLSFNNLSVTFKVDEQFKNYLEIFNWMIALGFPEKFDQYDLLASKSITTGESIKSDISIMLLNSAKTPKFAINIHDAFPILLSDLRFDTRDAQLTFIECSTTFQYTHHTIEVL